jgi:integrase
LKAIKTLLKQPDRKTFTGIRDYAVIILTLDTGIRPKESLSLLPGDINLGHLEIYVRAEKSKTRISRILPISSVTAKAIRKVIKVRPDIWDEEVPVFCSWEGG